MRVKKLFSVGEKVCVNTFCIGVGREFCVSDWRIKGKGNNYVFRYRKWNWMFYILGMVWRV